MAEAPVQPVKPAVVAPTTATIPAVKPTTAPLTPSGAAPKMVRSAPPFALGTPSGMGRYIKLLAYGASGSGKTELLASAIDVTEMNDVLMIDVEKGQMTIEDNPRLRNSEKLLNNRVQVDTFEKIAKVHDWLKGHLKFRDTDNVAKLKEEEARLRGCEPSDIVEPCRFRTVILDSITETDKYSNYELLGVTEAKVLTGDADEVDVAGWDEFRKNNQRIQMLLRAFRDLPMHLLVSALEQYKQDELKKFYYEPNVTGQLARQIPGFFDIVGRMTLHKQGDKATERRLYVQPVGNFIAKNRRSVYKGEFFTNPNMAMIMKETGLVKPTAP